MARKGGKKQELRIDDCRVGKNGGCKLNEESKKGKAGLGGAFVTLNGNRSPQVEGLGRWPANLIHDGSKEVVNLFPQVSASKSGGKAGWQDKYVGGKYKPIERTGYDEPAGTAARFFYCAKASNSDRGKGNNHPTVKPIDLMRYLIRLVCPVGSVVLDPFMGSGTTGKAALEEGMEFIGIEQSTEYMDISKKRLTNVAYQAGLFT